MNEFLPQLITRALWSLPYLCVWGVGLGICINFHAKNKLAANLAITAFSIFIVNLILSVLIQTWLISFQNEASSVSLSTSFAIAGGINTLLSIAGWIFLLIALSQLLQPKIEAATNSLN
jgi:hypothetical protein